MIERARAVAFNAATRFAPQLALGGLVTVALASRAIRSLRRLTGAKPRLVWGPMPIINIKYWSAALRARGYRSFTFVDHFYEIYAREDFDFHSEDFLGSGPFSTLARTYAVLGWLLLRADVFLSFLDGGFLRWTPLRDREGWLLKLAGAKLVAFPYGSDIAVPGHIGDAERPLFEDYPQLAEMGEATRQRVDWFCRWSDVVVRNYQYGYLPRWDVVWPTILAIDTEAWASHRPIGDGDGQNGGVVVVHAPNHRHVKATDGLIEAVEELQAEGLKVRLELLERRPNEEVKQAVLEAEIVADQFIAGYAMFAIEGLAAGKPVISALSWMPEDIRGTEALRRCPIVDTSIDTLKEDLRRLVENPGLREELGAAGREFALEFHSYEAVGQCWEAILDHLWGRAQLPAELPAQPAAAGP